MQYLYKKMIEKKTLPEEVQIFHLHILMDNIFMNKNIHIFHSFKSNIHKK